MEVRARVTTNLFHSENFLAEFGTIIWMHELPETGLVSDEYEEKGCPHLPVAC